MLFPFLLYVSGFGVVALTGLGGELVGEHFNEWSIFVCTITLAVFVHKLKQSRK